MLSFLPDREHIWHLIVALGFPVGAWEFFKHVYRWIFKRRSRLEQRLDLAEEEAKEKAKEILRLGSENKRLSTDLDDARSSLPQAAIERADREWYDHNTILAIGQLQRWFDANAESITAIALRLARFHISRAVPDPGDHIDRAHDMLRLARGASPHNVDANQLSRELDRINSALQQQLIRDGDAHIAWNSAMVPPLGAHGEAMLPAVNALRGIAQFCFDKGLWQLAPIFSDRAADLALSAGGALKRVWFAVETKAARHQIGIGHVTEGLLRIDHVLAEAQNFLPDRDEIALEARYVRAISLRNLGRYSEALAEIDTAVPIQIAALGACHPYTLALQHLWYSVFGDLGRYSEALVEIDTIAPIQAKVLGARDPYTLHTRGLRCSMLRGLGRYGEALSEIDTVALIQAEVLGACHPYTLECQRLRYKLLLDLGRYGEALSEIDTVYKMDQETFGLWHPQTLSTRSDQIGIEIATKRNVDHADELRKIIDALTAAEGQSNLRTLYARYHLSQILVQQKRVADARTEIVDIIARFDQMTDPGHCLLRLAEGLLGAIEATAN